MDPKTETKKELDTSVAVKDPQGRGPMIYLKRCRFVKAPKTTAPSIASALPDGPMGDSIICDDNKS
jgi:hypothetical protein